MPNGFAVDDFPQQHPIRRGLTTAVAMGLAWCCWAGPAPARADLIVKVESTRAWTKSIQNPLEFTLTNSGPEDVAVGAFTVGFSVSNPDLSLIDVTSDTTGATYIFQGNSAFGPSLVDPSLFPLSTPVLFADACSIAGGSITLLAGHTVGLGVLWFDAPDDRQLIQIELDPLMISFADDINLFPEARIQMMNGTLEIIPEPGTISLLLAGMVMVWSWNSRNLRKVPRCDRTSSLRPCPLS
jgi:hypothetical protein